MRLLTGHVTSRTAMFEGSENLGRSVEIFRSVSTGVENKEYVSNRLDPNIDATRI